MKNITKILFEHEYLEEGMLYEGGLARILQKTSEGPFAILTAFRNEYTLKQNRDRNHQLESSLKSIRAGAIKLTGFWQESLDGLDYKDAVAQGRVKDVTEESYFVAMPSYMDEEDFSEEMIDIMHKFNQDAIIYGNGENTFLLFKSGGSEIVSRGNSPTFNKISQFYSTLRGRRSPFVFEGCIQPSNNLHRLSLQSRGLTWFSET